MAVIQDAFEYGRIPLKPLAYNLKELAQCNELIIDYSGEDANYHIYIVSENDPNKLIDITQVIIDAFFNDNDINTSKFQVFLQNIDSPINLQDLLTEIYNKLLFKESEDFNPEDWNKLFKENTHSILLKDNNGNYNLPVTTTNNIYDSEGNSLETLLEDARRIRLSFSKTSIKTTEDNQLSFTFTYPYANYSDFIDIRIGSVSIDDTRYQLVNNIINNQYTTATVTFIDGTLLEKNRKIDILFIYDALAATKLNEVINGADIANKSISIDKLTKTSNLIKNDESSIATSAAVYNLFNLITEIAQTNNSFYTIDENNTNYLKCSIDSTINKMTILTITTIKSKTDLSKIIITQNNIDIEYALNTIDNNIPITTIAAGKTVRIAINTENNRAYLLTDNVYSCKRSKYVYRCRNDGGYTISYTGLNYEPSSIIDVYRNGVKLFEGVDYYIDKSLELISVYVRINEGEIFVFEALTN